MPNNCSRFYLPPCSSFWEGILSLFFHSVWCNLLTRIRILNLWWVKFIVQSNDIDFCMVGDVAARKVLMEEGRVVFIFTGFWKIYKSLTDKVLIIPPGAWCKDLSFHNFTRYLVCTGYFALLVRVQPQHLFKIRNTLPVIDKLKATDARFHHRTCLV